MTTSTTVIVRDPVDRAGLFDAARRIAGDAPEWNEHDFGDITMLQTAPGSFAEDGNPEGHALVLFTSSGFGDNRAAHGRLAGELLNWLAARGIKAAWRYEDDDWAWS